ncbi:hypothetical protein D3C78_1422450 [compost metagenome]
MRVLFLAKGAAGTDRAEPADRGDQRQRAITAYVGMGTDAHLPRLDTNMAELDRGLDAGFCGLAEGVGAACKLAT